MNINNNYNFMLFNIIYFIYKYYYKGIYYNLNFKDYL